MRFTLAGCGSKFPQNRSNPRPANHSLGANPNSPCLLDRAHECPRGRLTGHRVEFGFAPKLAARLHSPLLPGVVAAEELVAVGLVIAGVDGKADVVHEADHEL